MESILEGSSVLPSCLIEWHNSNSSLSANQAVRRNNSVAASTSLSYFELLRSKDRLFLEEEESRENIENRKYRYAYANNKNTGT